MPQLPNKNYSKDWEPTQRDRFDSVLNRNLSNLLRESSTEFNFLEIKDKVSRVINEIDAISRQFDYWAQLPEAKRSTFNSIVDSLAAHFNNLEAFDPKQNDPWSMRNALVAEFNSIYQTFYDNIVSDFGAFLGQKAYSQELMSKFGQSAETELKEIRRVKAEIEKVEIDVKEAAEVAGNIASTAQSASFADQANEHAISKSKWFKGVLGTSAVALLISLTVIYDIIRELEDQSFTANAEAYIFKVAMLAFLYLAIRFTIRNFTAHQHLYIINKQRANILSSMEAFRTSALDDKAKDSILLAAVGAAFAHQETGFITTKEGAGSDDGDVMEVVKTAIGK